MKDSSKPVYLGTIDKIEGVDYQASFDNPPPRKVITQVDYDRVVHQSNHKLEHFIFIPENWDLSKVEPDTSKPHYYRGNNFIPNTAVPDGSVIGFKSRVQSNIVLKDVKIGHSVELGDNVVLENCRVDDFVTMGNGVFLQDTRLGNGVIAASIENMEGCTVGYNFDCAHIEDIGAGNVFQRDFYVETVGSTHKNNQVKTVSNTTEPLNIDDFLPSKNNDFVLNAN